MADLKRCPFCGGMPETSMRVVKMGGDEDMVEFSVCCIECKTNKSVILSIKGKALFFDVEKAMETAIGKWNRRAE